MKLTGRVLVLTDDPALLREQLDGADLAAEANPLHYGVNTDAMISGAACTLGYTPEILGPWFLDNFKETLSKDTVKNGGFQVIVGGDAYGSGSSREVAVVAHQGAGISSHNTSAAPRPAPSAAGAGQPWWNTKTAAIPPTKPTPLPTDKSIWPGSKIRNIPRAKVPVSANSTSSWVRLRGPRKSGSRR